MNNPLISIIVPVYNVESYLRQCLDSILAQTISDWECILVDDGSPDRSGDICDEYAKKDNRFKVIHKENGGVSSARNLGIEKASGDWFLFCDADDLLYEETLTNFVSRIRDDIDSICGGYVEIDCNDKPLRMSSSKEYELTIGREDALIDFYKSSYGVLFNGYLWNRLLNADIIKRNHLKFREDIYIKEDGLFLVQYLCKCPGEHTYMSVPVYKYRQNMEGAMKSYNKLLNKKSLSNLYSRCYCYDIIRKRTNNQVLLKLSRDCISQKFIELFFRTIKNRKGDFKELVMMFHTTFKFVSPFSVIQWYVGCKITK